jgi:hypothetical protein
MQKAQALTVRAFIDEHPVSRHQMLIAGLILLVVLFDGMDILAIVLAVRLLRQSLVPRRPARGRAAAYAGRAPSHSAVCVGWSVRGVKSNAATLDLSQSCFLGNFRVCKSLNF